MLPAGYDRTSGAGVLLIAFLCGGCSADTSTLTSLTSATASAPLPISTSSDPPVDVYARLARGALKCWFGPEGSLKKTHVFHAKVDPPSMGHAAEIAVHTRTEGSTHGVLRAFGISITPSGTGSVVEAKNYRFSEAEANLMIADVGRWTAGNDDCSVVGTGGWNAAAPSGDAVPAKPNAVPAPAAGPAILKK
jgi:hypothetical protein